VIYFLDLEASSLLPGGFPIEIAWVDETGHGESYLICPADVWLDEDKDHPNWSWESEQVHRIRLSTLLVEGIPHDDVPASPVKLSPPPRRRKTGGRGTTTRAGRCRAPMADLADDRARGPQAAHLWKWELR
jgi:hypothetical protein